MDGQTRVSGRSDVLAVAVAARPRSVRGVLEAGGGWVVGTRGDNAVLCLFRTAAQAAVAVLAMQQQYPARVAVHVAELSAADDAHAAMRSCDALIELTGEGRTMLSAHAAAAMADVLPDGACLQDRGRSGDEHVVELLQGDGAGEDVAAGGRRRPPAHNLPAQLTTFVGRSAELAALRALVNGHRLVTVTGAGGAGKTRLARQVAAGMMDGAPDGVWWVDLGAVTDPVRVPRVVASAVRALVEPSGDVVAMLAAQLRGRRALLCLDTCEHLLDACAVMVHAVLVACPELTVLATSRERLGVPGELVWRVPPLDPDDAARLFADRAALVRPGPPDPVADVEEGAAVAAICRRLDGVPLAIELAAAWTRVLDPSAIEARLDDRFGLLVDGPRGVDDRHRTLAASIGWSHDLLDVADQTLLHELSVFAGGFTAEAAAAVCGPDTLAGIARLVDKSLVVVETRTATRFRLLDSVREYAARELETAGAAALRDRHLDHYVAFAENAAPRLERDQDRWRTALLAEHDNLRAALEWGFTGPDPGRARRLAAALARFWFLTRNVWEGKDFLHRALAAAPDDRTALQAALLAGAGLIAVAAGLPAEAARLAEQALEIADAVGDDTARARSHVVLGAGSVFFTDQKKSGWHARQAERFGLAAGDPFAIDSGCLLRARALTNTDRHAEAAAAVRDRAAGAQTRGERMVGGFLLGVEVRAALFTGDLRRATRLGQEAVATTEPLGDLYALGHTTVDLAWITGLRGDLTAAGRLMDPILTAAGAAGAEPELVKWFAVVPGKLHMWAGEDTEAVRWFEIAARFAEPDPDNWVVAQALPGLAAALRRLGDPDGARVHAERALALATAVEMPHVRAEALDELALLAPTPAVAEDLHRQALDVRVAASLWTFVVHSYDALAASAAAGDPLRAARVLGACDAARERADHPRPPVERPGHAALLARLRSALGEADMAQAMAGGAALSRADLHAYLDRPRGARRRPATGWDGLTRAEREVVALVAGGYTNPQIAERLFMSRSTVKTHLAHVFAKLGITSRAELAAVAARHAAPDA